ncbi:MAG: acetate kinase [Cellvibrionaceae bacterium]|nr:acetate kinase [Cellvibrionaceae bacterium]|tara:strand:- start:32518 stop:33720 length:1203 start_codon:yes stop_codon:yes gene_type:complete
MIDQPLILVINCGSSSLKFALIEPSQGYCELDGIAENLASPQAIIRWSHHQQEHQKAIADGAHSEAGQGIIELLEKVQLRSRVVAIGHRVVHGGKRFSESVLIDEAVTAAVEACSSLAPLHNPANLVGIEVTTQYFPGLPQVAVFDTAFHQSMTEQAFLYALPLSLYRDHGVRRYGFHGTSFRYVSAQATRQLSLKADDHGLVIAHLGNGASACAVHNGKSVDTTMGLTPLEGLVMGTRSGNIDPGLLLFLHQRCHYSIEEIDSLLNKRSGLLGLSELSNDMRTLEDAADKGNTQADLAIRVFCYQLAKQLAGLMTAIPRCDGLIFTGGIGENSRRVRHETVQHLGSLGWAIDPDANLSNGESNQGKIHQSDSPIIAVIATDEELMIAKDVVTLTNSQQR